MRKFTYFAVFEPSTSGGYGVYFPDLPGCTSFGADYNEAVKMAEEALSYHIYEMEKDGDKIPAPTQPDKLDIDKETTGGYLVSSVTVFPELVKNQLDNRAVKTNLTLPAWLKEAAENSNINFSQFLQSALKEHLQVRENNR